MLRMLRKVLESLGLVILSKYEHHWQVSIERTADWWLGNLESQYFKILERAVEEEWSVKPSRIGIRYVGFWCLDY